MLRLGDRLRIDTGLFVPIFLTEPDTTFDISIPIDFWIQESTPSSGP